MSCILEVTACTASSETPCFSIWRITQKRFSQPASCISRPWNCAGSLPTRSERVISCWVVVSSGVMSCQSPCCRG